MWAYNRIDTERPDTMDLFRSAGVRWLAVGVEAGNQAIRKEASKGSFQDVDVRTVVSQIEAAEIDVIANYIFGLPDDNRDTMQETLDLALELNTSMANMYPCQALPGSTLYREAVSNNWKLPSSHAGYAFLSYDCEPLPTRHLTGAEVLAFRDKAWQTYFRNPEYLAKVEAKFGMEQRQNVEKMAAVSLRRRLLQD